VTEPARLLVKSLFLLDWPLGPTVANVRSYVKAGSPLRIRGGSLIDTATGESTREDIGISDGVVVPVSDLDEPRTIDAGGRYVLFGLNDVHAHPGGLMYDPCADGYFENLADRTVRAGANLLEAVTMGVTGVRAVGEAEGADLAWSRAFARGDYPGPRLLCAGPIIRTTGGHGTAYPREYLHVTTDLIGDGADAMRHAVRYLGERGVDWIKICLTGGLYSKHESVDGGQLNTDELSAVMATAQERGLPVAAHCGSARLAEEFARLGGRSVEHGYALDEAAAKVMADHGCFLVPTIGVTHDIDLIVGDGWPDHARIRAEQTAPGHADGVRAALDVGVKLACGADLNPIGARLHAELRILESIGIDRRVVLHAATSGGRELLGLGDSTKPAPGDAADLIIVDGDPLDDLAVLRAPSAVIVFGRLIASQPVKPTFSRRSTSVGVTVEPATSSPIR
jgi:imidazolonepropionase-like amidohydrolase